MARDIVDDRLVGALHLHVTDRTGFAQDRPRSHTAYQAGTINALMDGRFAGDATIGELLGHGDLGIGTVRHLAGELVVVDGEAHLVDGDGVVSAVEPDTPTPFAVVCRFAPAATGTVDGALDLAGLHAALDDLARDAPPVVAVRADGTFADLHLRSVHAQHPPYPTLAEVTAHQTEWRIAAAEGTVVGFRFPDEAAGIEVPGHHLHFLSSDRRTGGHVLGLRMLSGRLAVDGEDRLRLELPGDVSLDEPGVADRGAIARAEGGSVGGDEPDDGAAGNRG